MNLCLYAFFIPQVETIGKQKEKNNSLLSPPEDNINIFGYVFSDLSKLSVSIML